MMPKCDCGAIATFVLAGTAACGGCYRDRHPKGRCPTCGRTARDGCLAYLGVVK